MADSDWEEIPKSKDSDWEDVSNITENKPSALYSFGNHALQGATGGFSDEMVGAGEALGKAMGVDGAGSRSPLDMSLSKEGPTLDWETLRDAYRMARDKDRQGLRDASKYHGDASGVGEIAGMVASPLNKLGGGLSAAKQAALLGGINGLGSSDSEDPTQVLKDTALGTGTGLALGKGIDVASPYLEAGVGKLAGSLRSGAENLAARALGAERGTIKKLGMDKIKAAGGQALDEGALPLFGGTDAMIEKNDAIKAKGGKMMGQVYDAIDNAGASTFNPQDVAEKVNENLGGFWRSPLNKAEANQFDNTIESILVRGDHNIPLSEAQSLKQELGQAANWKNNIQVSPKEQMARDAYHLVNQSIDDAVEQGSGAVNAAGLKDTLAAGKKLYSNASTADQLLQNKQAREQGNKLFGLTDSIMGAGALGYGATTGDWKDASGIMLAKKGLEKFGPKLGARGLNGISGALQKSPQLAQMFAKSPQLATGMATSLSKWMMPKQDEPAKGFDKDSVLEKANGTQYAQVLQNAAKRGDQALGATHFILQSTDPKYREAISKEDGDLEP